MALGLFACYGIELFAKQAVSAAALSCRLPCML